MRNVLFMRAIHFMLSMGIFSWVSVNFANQCNLYSFVDEHVVVYGALI